MKRVRVNISVLGTQQIRLVRDTRRDLTVPDDDLLFVIEPLPDFCSMYSRMYIIGMENIEATCSTIIKIDDKIGMIDVSVFPMRKQRPEGRVLPFEINLYNNMILVDTVKLSETYRTIQLQTIVLSRNMVSNGFLTTDNLDRARKFRAKHNNICDAKAKLDEM